MLTLAFAQITWAIAFQWDEITGGSNGLVGVWPAAWLSNKIYYFYLVLVTCAVAIAALWRVAHSPFGYALRGGRDSPLRAEAIGIDVSRSRWVAFLLSGAFAGLAGALYAFSKGSISPETLAIPRSVDGLVMVLLGGVHSLVGPVIGAGVFTWLQDTIARETEYWRALLGAVIIVIVLLFPNGIAGMAARWRKR
jgi:branched-chain amino acid transport system permease protein